MASALAGVAVVFLVGCAGPDRRSDPPGTSGSVPGSATLLASPASGGPGTPMPGATADPASDLVVLSGRIGAMALGRIGPDGRTVTMSPPDANASWVSTGPSGELLVTTLDGRAFLGTDAASDGSIAWRPLPVTRPGTEAAATGLAFGTLSSDGTAAAFIAGSGQPVAEGSGGGPGRGPGGGSGGPAGPSIVRVSLPAGGAAWLPLGGEPSGSPPTWLGGELLVLRRTAGDRIVAARADETGLVPWTGRVGSGSAAPLPDRTVALSGSADGTVLAVLHGGLDTVTVVHPTALDGAVSPSGQPSADSESATLHLEPLADGSRVAGAIALSPTGDRLAVVRVDAFGNAVTVEIRAADEGWARVGGWDLPIGADRAVVAWLP